MRLRPPPFRCVLPLLGAFFILPAGPSAAYIGPGAGLGAIAVTLALVVGGLLLVVGLLWYPLKRLLKRRGRPAGDASSRDGTTGTG